MSRGNAALVGLGMSPQGRHLGVSRRELLRQAVDAALRDGGLDRGQLDGCISIGSQMADLRYLGLAPDLAFSLNAGGASPGLAILAAAGLVATGQATHVACMYSESFTSQPVRLMPNLGVDADFDLGGFSYGYPYMYGLVGPGSVYALAARRYLETYGATSEDLGRVAVVEREYASVRPGAMGFDAPITLADHQGSRLIADPLRLLDCSRPTDGAVVVIVTSEDRAADCAGVPVSVLGSGVGHNLTNWWSGDMFERLGGTPHAAQRAYGQAGIGPRDICLAQLYAPFTVAVLLQLEEYGFCDPGAAGGFVRDGQTGPKGSIPTNTGGGQLSGFYATGFTPLSEGILQVRGQAPSNQINDVELCLVSGSGGNGGVQGSWAHVSLVLGPTR